MRACSRTDIRRPVHHTDKESFTMITRWFVWLTYAPDLGRRAGMTTAELLGNAALGIAALVAIWAVLQTLGLDVVDWIRGQLQM